jgi:transposase
MKESGKVPRRHDISDTLWEKIEALLPGRAGKTGSGRSGQPTVYQRAIVDFQNRHSMQRCTL